MDEVPRSERNESNPDCTFTMKWFVVPLPKETNRGDSDVTAHTPMHVIKTLWVVSIFCGLVPATGVERSSSCSCSQNCTESSDKRCHFFDYPSETDVVVSG